MTHAHLPRLTLGRRGLMLSGGAVLAAGPCRLAFANAGTEKRFVVVLLRGALDGLAAVVPHGDPDLGTWRAGLVPPPQGQDALLDLGGFFGMHATLAGMHTLFAVGECLPVHAVAGAYRTRSHFDAQDYLECGAPRRLDSGWLNRVALCLPPHRLGQANAMAMGPDMPLLLRGSAAVGNYAPDVAEQPHLDLYARIAALHADDTLTGPIIVQGLQARSFAVGALGGREKPAPVGEAFQRFCAAAGRLLAAQDGPRIAAVELGGWDTHADQANRLKQPLRQLDAGILALRQALGPVWAETVVLVATEFGRTVRINGTLGTDHGTGTVAFVLGGRVNGGRVAGDWPGLRQTALLEDRDLRPTTDFSGVAKGVLSAHLGLKAPQLETVFPGSTGVAAVSGLLRV